MASSFGNDLEVMLLNWAFTDAAAPTRPTAWFVSLHTADPGETGGNEMTGTGYARDQATFSDSTTGAAGCSNEAEVVFTNSGGTSWTEAVGFGVWTLLSGGVFLGGGALTANKTVGAGDTATFAIGDLDITMT